MLFLVGLGGAGCRVTELFYKKGVLGSLIRRVSTSAEKPIKGVAVDTSRTLEKLSSIPVGNRVLIGKSRAKGHGVGGDVALGRKIITEEHELAISAMTEAGFGSAEAVFLIAGLGGGTGTGGFPVLARKIKSVYQVQVIGVLFLPSRGEGTLYSKNAVDGFPEAEESVDGLIILDSNALTSMGEVITKAYRAVDEAVVNFFGTTAPGEVLKRVKGRVSTIASVDVKARPTALKDIIKDMLRNHLYMPLENFTSLHLTIYGERGKIYGQGFAEDWVKKKFGGTLSCSYMRPFNPRFIHCNGIITGVTGIEKRLAVEIRKREVSSELQSLLEDINPL